MLRVGIIGMGYGAQVCLPALQLIDALSVKALSDSGSGRARQYADQLGADIATFSSGVDLMESSQLDAVIIATPPQFHEALLTCAMDKPFKILCEKPFCQDLAAAKRVFDSCPPWRRKDIAIGLEFRFDAMFSQMISLIKGGFLGRIHDVDVKWFSRKRPVNRDITPNWKADGVLGSGLIDDWSCHVIDYLHALGLGDILQVMVRTTDKQENLNLLEDLQIKCQFAHGASGRIHIAKIDTNGFGHFVTVRGEKGTLFLKHELPFRRLDKHLSIEWVSGERQVYPAFYAEEHEQDNRVSAFEYLIRNFLLPHQVTKPITPACMEDVIRLWCVNAALRTSLLNFGRVVSVDYVL